MGLAASCGSGQWPRARRHSVDPGHPLSEHSLPMQPKKCHEGSSSHKAPLQRLSRAAPRRRPTACRQYSCRRILSRMSLARAPSSPRKRCTIGDWPPLRGASSDRPAASAYGHGVGDIVERAMQQTMPHIVPGIASPRWQNIVVFSNALTIGTSMRLSLIASRRTMPMRCPGSFSSPESRSSINVSSIGSRVAASVVSRARTSRANSARRHDWPDLSDQAACHCLPHAWPGARGAPPTCDQSVRQHCEMPTSCVLHDLPCVAQESLQVLLVAEAFGVDLVDGLCAGRACCEPAIGCNDLQAVDRRIVPGCPRQLLGDRFAGQIGCPDESQATVAPTWPCPPASPEHRYGRKRPIRIPLSAPCNVRPDPFRYKR